MYKRKEGIIYTSHGHEKEMDEGAFFIKQKVMHVQDTLCIYDIL